MNKKNKYIFLSLTFMLVFSQLYFAQNVRERIFEKVDKLKREAEVRDAELLSPINFAEALENYNDASEGLQEGDDLADIKSLVRKAENIFRKAIEYSIDAAKKFPELLRTRNDALKIGADTLSVSTWEEAESSLKDAMEELEDNSQADAEEYAFEAEKLFRKCELEAIKIIVCGPTWDLLEKADDENVKNYAPLTLKEARQFIYSAEKELEDKRYNNKYAQQLADKAYSEAQHALSITDYLKLTDDNDTSDEEIILFYEEPLKAIAEKLGIVPKFENGYSSLLHEISLKLETVSALEKEFVGVKKERDNLLGKIEKLNGELSSLNTELNVFHSMKERILKVKNSFKVNEAEIFTLNDKIFIRLKKLSFASGSAVISPRYFELLTRVIKSIELFPKSRVTVAAHTDGSGKSEKNLVISQRRADAVYQYLLANSTIGRKRLSAIGYGEKQPISSNETTAGKMRNRRIEIIIDSAKP
jgi:outer membrane protein OmpA-like peptidoglycan-associated protein